MASNDEPPLTYPPDIGCLRGLFLGPTAYYIEELNCSISDDTVNFLNLTGSQMNILRQFVNVYCLKPPPEDICPFGFCPNPDIAGPLVRFSNYITGFCLIILIFYSPKRVKEAYWSQTLITYSLLLTCGVSLIRGELTRYHAIVLISIVCSPVNVYFTGYSIRAFWGSHRLDAVLGKKQYLRRALVFFSLAVWITILVYAYLPRKYTKFTQDSCRWDTVAENFFLGSPFVWAVALARSKSFGDLVAFLALPVIVIVAWVFAIVRKRKEIWPPGELYRPRFGRVWRKIVTDYMFLQFLSVIATPTAYWVAYVEIGVFSQWDVDYSLTFGQLLAVFMTVPPMIEVGRLAPRLWRWFINIHWVRYITGRRAPRVPGPEEMGSPAPDFVDEKEGTADDESGLVYELPLLGKTREADDLEETTEHVTLLGDHGTALEAKY
ncbi:hypothetical protein BJ322DRAFT_1076724 [Thelephora terrestris]|uniref:Uncharacterized protein n=1 Tax=Thelephora terrestris TaxID=56493 RepID=A0A9P6H833_9AGAM|nr:hypothetical protein BJ322DRAFT_1076724 [Thelephora terrestris]